VARLAVETEALVVPVAIWDTERVWPRSDKVPRVMELLQRRPVHAKVGEPMTLKGTDFHALAESVMDRIRELLPGG
jgi:putative phosphoserine phosphatase/1-acylglycerol-3-phosphate O-acyltransferase